MLLIAGKRLWEKGEHDKAASQFRIAQKVMDAFKDDFLEERWFDTTIYESTQEQRKQISELLNE
jgi:hypothetical protein